MDQLRPAPRTGEPEKPMEKYGVSCSCPNGKPEEGELIKTASGDRKCGVCGRVYPAKGAQDESTSTSDR